MRLSSATCAGSLALGACLDTGPFRTVTDLVGMAFEELASELPAAAPFEDLTVFGAGFGAGLGGLDEGWVAFFFKAAAGDRASFEL